MQKYATNAAARAAQLYHQRERQRARAEMTASEGGMRDTRETLGLEVTVELTLEGS